MVGRMPTFLYSTLPLLKKQVTNWSLSALSTSRNPCCCVWWFFLGGGVTTLQGKESRDKRWRREENQVHSEWFLVPLLMEATESLSWFQCKTNKEGMSFSLWFARLQTGAVLAWAAKPCWEPWQTYLVTLPALPSFITHSLWASNCFWMAALNPAQNHKTPIFSPSTFHWQALPG